MKVGRSVLGDDDMVLRASVTATAFVEQLPGGRLRSLAIRHLRLVVQTLVREEDQQDS